MNKIFNKKYINILVIIISILLYVYMMFFSEITLDTGKKELENILLLALPCFMLLFYSFSISNKLVRKRILIIYLIFYLLAIIGFTFANFRDNILIDNGIMDRGYNLIPFKSICILLSSPLGLKVAIYNIMGNFLMLTPFAILLPLINDKFKKMRIFLMMITLVSLLIEIGQYITRIGSFDIDDLILNVSGVFILYLVVVKIGLFKYLYKLFYEVRLSRNISSIIYSGLLIMLIIVYGWYCSLIYIRYQEKKIDFSNLRCVLNEKTYLGTIGRYNYYSECKLEGYVRRGNENIDVDDIINRLGLGIDEYSLDLGLIKEEAITDIQVELSKGVRRLVYDTDKHKKYLIDIDRISYYKNGIECIIEDSLPSNEEDCSAELVEVVKSDMNKGYVIAEGKYYNELSCITGMYHEMIVVDYIVPKDYVLDWDSCSKIWNYD